MKRIEESCWRHIPNIKQRAFVEEEMVRSILIGEAGFNTLLIASAFESYELLDTICCLNPPTDWLPSRNNPQYYYVRWRAHALQMRINNAVINPGQDFYLAILNELGIEDHNRSSIWATLSSESQIISDSVVQRNITDLIELRKSPEGSLVDALQPSIALCLKKIVPRKLFEDYDLDILNIYHDVSSEGIQYFPLQNINGSNIKTFLRYLIMLRSQKVTDSLQSAISLLETAKFQSEQPKTEFKDFLLYYPKNFDELILANESISKRDHFISILWKKEKIKIIYDKNNAIPFENDLYPYFLMACFDRVYVDKRKLGQCQHICTQKYTEMIAEREKDDRREKDYHLVFDVFQRITNDDSIVSYISQTIGTRKTLEDLATKSIPLLFIRSFSSFEYKQHDRIFHTESFLVSEEEMSNTQSFFYSSLIYRNIIEFVVGRRDKIPDYFKSSLLESVISYVTDKKIRDVLLTDLFSLIFFCDPNGKYYCDIAKAEAIIGFVAYQFPNTQLLNDANRHIMYAKLRNKTDLKGALISNDCFLLELIEKDQLNVALTMSSTHPRYKTLIQLINCIKFGDINNVNRAAYAVELFLAKNVVNDWLNDLDGADSKYYNDFILTAVKKLIDVHRLYDDPISLHRKKPNLLHTTSYKEYTELYQKFQISTQHKIDNRLSPSEIIKLVRENEDFANLKNLETLLGSHALEFVLLYSKDINDRLFNIIKNESPTTAQAIRYENGLNGKFKKEENDTVYERFLNKKFRKKMGEDEDEDDFVIIQTDTDPLIDQSDLNLLPLTQDDVLKLIDKAVSTKPLPYNFLNELYIRSPKIYTEKMISYIDKFTISQLLEIYPFCGMRSFPILDRMNVTKISIPAIVDLLMETMQWNTLQLFIKDFSKDDEIYNNMFKYLEVHPEMIDITPKNLLSKVDYELIEHQNVDEQSERATVNTENLDDLIHFIEENEHLDANETIESINRALNPIVIDDIMKEEKFCRQLRKLTHIFGKRAFKTSFATKLRALSTLLSKNLNARYGLQIVLANFSTETFGSKMATTSLKYDYFQECLDFCAAWSLDISLFKAEQAKQAFRLGIVDVGYENIVPPIRNDAVIDQIVDILSHTFIFDMSSIVETDNEIEMVNLLVKMETAQNRWRQIIEGFMNVLAGSPQIKTLHKVLFKLNTIDKLIIFYAASGYFDDAFDAWNTIQRPQTKSELFIRAIVYPALISKNWNSLWFKVKKIESMKPFYMDLFKYLDQKKMGLTAYLVQMRLCLYSMAYQTALKYFNLVNSWEAQKKLINAMKDACQKEESLSAKMNKLDFELLLIDKLIECNVTFTNTINILSSKENALNTAVFYLKNGGAEIVMSRLVPMMMFTLNEMCHALLDDVMQGEMGALHKFFKSIEQIDAQNYEVIVMNLFQAIKIRVADPGSLSKFIDANVRDDLKGQIFITFGFLMEAYNIAKKTSDRFLKQCILENAEKINDVELCEKVRADLQQ